MDFATKPLELFWYVIIEELYIFTYEVWPAVKIAWAPFPFVLIVVLKIIEDEKFVTKIAELIPNRTVNSIHSFCHRKFNPFNYKGKWTKKNEEKLLQLVWEKGKKWTEMSKIFERTPINCRDKYKSLGGDFYIAVQKKAKLKLDLKLLKAVYILQKLI